MRLITPQTGLFQGLRTGAPPIIIRGGYCSEAKDLIAKMTVEPNDALKRLINKTFIDLKDAGILAKGDCLYFRDIHDSQASTLNWIKNEHNSTYVLSPIFWKFAGVRGNGVQQYINNNYNPYTQAVKMQLNNLTILCEDAIIGTGIGRYRYGALKTTPQSYLYENFKPATSLRGYIQTLSYGCAYEAQNQRLEGWILKREANKNNLYASVDGIATINRADIGTNAQFPDYNFYELAINSNGGVGNPYNGVRAFLYLGKALSDSENLALRNIRQYWKDNKMSTLDIGSEMITNGGFDADTDWTKSNGSWTISGGKANYDDITTNVYISPIPGVAIVLGKQYKLAFTISGLTTGYAALLMLNHASTGGFLEWETSTKYFTNGSYEFIITATGNFPRFRLHAYTLSDSSFSIDNFSLKQLA